MTQVFIFGDSVAYGVGAQQAGWADLLKQYLHAKMYAQDGIGEKYELYNFSKPGVGVDFVLETYGELLRHYRRDNKTIALICIGGNDTKATGQPSNFVSSIEEYKVLTLRLLQALKAEFDELIIMPTLIAVDESKVNPKISPFTGGKSFFTNSRIQLFNTSLQNLCKAQAITCVAVDIEPYEWVERYLYDDGLHPNQEGHQRIFETTMPVVEGLL